MSYRLQTMGRTALVSVLLAASGLAQATDGTNAVVVIDPTDPVSLYVGHYYKAARDIPDHHVIYMPITSSNYTTFRQFQLPIVRAVLTERNLDQLVDFVVLAPSDTFFVAAPGLVVDACSPVSRFSITSAYASVFLDDVFAAGGVPVLYPNPYGRPNSVIPLYFSGFAGYSNGLVSGSGSRQLIGSLLGYTGERGNTVEEIITMIDRSVASDATSPIGTVYYMRTTDAARSGPRHDSYPTVIDEINALGGNAVQINANLPTGQHDAMGVMSGFANTNIENANFTMLPGSFGDHLTSWACTFDNSNQTKASQWIRKGASGSYGAVQEPCNYPNKFPHARMHAFYYQGLPLGAAVWRSLAAFPFQGLLLGDPLTNPYDIPPIAQITVEPGVPGPGLARVSYTASTPKPGASLTSTARVYVDGSFAGVTLSALPLNLNTTIMSDGWHEVRITIHDTTAVRADTSSATGLVVDNLGRSVEFLSLPTSASLNDTLTIDARAFGSGVSEVRLLQHGRIVAATPGREGRIRLPARVLGRGVSNLQLEALYADGMQVRSAPVAIDLTDAAANPSPQAPQSFAYAALLQPSQDRMIHLPFATDGNLSQLSFQVLTAPTQASINAGTGGSSVLITPNANASGMDRLVYRVTGPGGSTEASIRISYDGSLPDDRNGDGEVDIEDLYHITQNPFDITGDGQANSADWQLMEQIIRAEIPFERPR